MGMGSDGMGWDRMGSDRIGSLEGPFGNGRSLLSRKASVRSVAQTRTHDRDQGFGIGTRCGNAAVAQGRRFESHLTREALLIGRSVVPKKKRNLNLGLKIPAGEGGGGGKGRGGEAGGSSAGFGTMIV